MSTAFPDMASRAFSFLEDAGFRLVKRNRALVLYESEQAFVGIDWDAPRAGELNVYIGCWPEAGEPLKSFSLGDLLAMQGVKSPQSPGQFAFRKRTSSNLFLNGLRRTRASMHNRR
jgi:hypothetical protein